MVKENLVLPKNFLESLAKINLNLLKKNTLNLQLVSTIREALLFSSLLIVSVLNVIYFQTEFNDINTLKMKIAIANICFLFYGFLPIIHAFRDHNDRYYLDISIVKFSFYMIFSFLASLIHITVLFPMLILICMKDDAMPHIIVISRMLQVFLSICILNSSSLVFLYMFFLWFELKFIKRYDENIVLNTIHFRNRVNGTFLILILFISSMIIHNIRYEIILCIITYLIILTIISPLWIYYNKRDTIELDTLKKYVILFKNHLRNVNLEINKDDLMMIKFIFERNPYEILKQSDDLLKKTIIILEKQFK